MPIRRNASVLPGSAVSGRGLRKLHEADGAALAVDRRRHLAAYLALIDKVCPCVLLVHSQGGNFGFHVAEERPDKIKAIVAIESATAGKVANAPKLKDVPVLMVFGDYVDQHPRWATFKKIDTRICQRDQGGGRQGRCHQSSRAGHQGQFAHAHAGQEQCADRRRHSEVAGRQGIIQLISARGIRAPATTKTDTGEEHHASHIDRFADRHLQRHQRSPSARSRSSCATSARFISAAG